MDVVSATGISGALTLPGALPEEKGGVERAPGNVPGNVPGNQEETRALSTVQVRLQRDTLDIRFQGELEGEGTATGPATRGKSLYDPVRHQLRRIGHAVEKELKSLAREIPGLGKDGRKALRELGKDFRRDLRELFGAISRREGEGGSTEGASSAAEGGQRIENPGQLVGSVRFRLLSVTAEIGPLARGASSRTQDILPHSPPESPEATGAPQSEGGETAEDTTPPAPASTILSESIERLRARSEELIDELSEILKTAPKSEAEAAAFNFQFSRSSLYLFNSQGTLVAYREDTGFSINLSA